MSGTVANVVTVVALGIVLNVAAVSMVEGMRPERRPTCGRATLRLAAKTELKVVRTVVTSTLKRISDGRRQWCVAQSWAMGLQREVADVRGQAKPSCARRTDGEWAALKIVLVQIRKRSVCDASTAKSAA